MLDALLAHLHAAIAHWESTDPVMAALAREHPPQEMAIRPSDAAREGAQKRGQARQASSPAAHLGFAVMAQSIVHQQVSLAAGRTIWSRVEAATGGVPDGFLAAGEAGLRAAGLSRQKASYCLDLANRTLDGTLDWSALPGMTDGEVIAGLTAVKGIGTWTAKMFLIFHLQRPDVCPWEDLGVRLAVERFYGIPAQDAAAWLRAEAAPRWSPHNTLAARVLWNARRE